MDFLSPFKDTCIQKIAKELNVTIITDCRLFFCKKWEEGFSTSDPKELIALLANTSPTTVEILLLRHNY